MTRPDEMDFTELDKFVLDTPLAQVPADFETRLQAALDSAQPSPEARHARSLRIVRWAIASGGLCLALMQLLRFVLSAWLISHLAY